MNFLSQTLITIWLLFLSFYAWLVRFNKYWDSSIIDCDKDAEDVFVIFTILIWLTTLLIWGLHFIDKRLNHSHPLQFINWLSLVLSIAFIPKFIGWYQYSTLLSKICK